MKNMITVDLNTIELAEFRATADENQHCKATFPILGAHGSKALAAVYFELEKGDHLGAHTDSAEELLIILNGTAKVRTGGNLSTVKKGQLVLVPEMVEHDLENIGDDTLKVLGVFGGANNIIATFQQELWPVGTNVVDTSVMS